MSENAKGTLNLVACGSLVIAATIFLTSCATPEIRGKTQADVIIYSNFVEDILPVNSQIPILIMSGNAYSKVADLSEEAREAVRTNAEESERHRFIENAISSSLDDRYLIVTSSQSIAKLQESKTDWIFLTYFEQAETSRFADEDLSREVRELAAIQGVTHISDYKFTLLANYCYGDKDSIDPSFGKITSTARSFDRLMTLDLDFVGRLVRESCKYFNETLPRPLEMRIPLKSQD